MAMLMELNYDKKYILERYMNTVYLAQQGSMAIHGFSSASQLYFDKKVDDLDLREMATLVALLKGPSYYHPVKYPDRLNKRVVMILSMHNKYKKNYSMNILAIDTCTEVASVTLVLNWSKNK